MIGLHYRDFAVFERILASLLIFFPLILILVDGEVRTSISDYVYMDSNFVYGILLAIASMMLITNGVIYFRNPVSLADEKGHSKSYNIILGLALLGVAALPHEDPNLRIFHLVCAIIFFTGSTLAIALFNYKRHRALCIIISLVALLSFAIHFYDEKVLSLFWAEWISLTIIAIHFILESLNIISFSRHEIN